MTTNREWICTDPDSKQYGREVTPWIWEYKQPDINDGEPVTIALKDYTIEQIEDNINPFGYTLNCNGNYKFNIWQEYGSSTMQIICECLFEMEEKPKV